MPGQEGENKNPNKTLGPPLGSCTTCPPVKNDSPQKEGAEAGRYADDCVSSQLQPSFLSMPVQVQCVAARGHQVRDSTHSRHNAVDEMHKVRRPPCLGRRGHVSAHPLHSQTRLDAHTVRNILSTRNALNNISVVEKHLPFLIGFPLTSSCTLTPCHCHAGKSV